MTTFNTKTNTLISTNNDKDTFVKANEMLVEAVVHTENISSVDRKRKLSDSNETEKLVVENREVATILTYTNTWIIATIHTIIITLTREMTTFNTKTNTLISTTCKATTTYTVNFTAIVTLCTLKIFQV
jgi:hypothetical protein